MRSKLRECVFGCVCVGVCVGGCARSGIRRQLKVEFLPSLQPELCGSFAC